MMTREERKQRVAAFVRGAGTYISIAEVAAGVGLRKTPYLRDMLAELCREGVLASFQHEFPNGTTGRMYLDAKLLERMRN